MSKHTFDPRKVGFKKHHRGYREIVYNLYDKKRKLIGWMVYHDFMTPPYWLLYQEIHHADGSGGGSSSTMVYKGDINSISFARQLLKNTRIK